MDTAAQDAITVQNADSIKRQADASAAALVVMGQQAATQVAMLAAVSVGEAADRWMSLYQMHLTVRLGPTIITTGTADAIINDIVADAFRMTTLAWPLVKPELDKLT